MEERNGKMTSFKEYIRTVLDEPFTNQNSSYDKIIYPKLSWELGTQLPSRKLLKSSDRNPRVHKINMNYVMLILKRIHWFYLPDNSDKTERFPNPQHIRSGNKGWGWGGGRYSLNWQHKKRLTASVDKENNKKQKQVKLWKHNCAGANTSTSLEWTTVLL